MAAEPLRTDAWPTSSTPEQRQRDHGNLLNGQTANVGLLLDHLVNEHGVHPEEFDRRNRRGNRVALVVMHLARHDKTAEAVAQGVVDHIEIHGPIPEGGIVVLRGGNFEPEVFQYLRDELLRVTGHDNFVLILLGSDTPAAVAVLDAKMGIEEIKAKLGVD